jgi:hypothetical protein
MGVHGKKKKKWERKDNNYYTVFEAPLPRISLYCNKWRNPNIRLKADNARERERERERERYTLPYLPVGSTSTNSE